MRQAGECGLRPGLGGRAGVVGGLARLKVPALEIRANDQVGNGQRGGGGADGCSGEVIASVVNGLAATIIVAQLLSLKAPKMYCVL